MRPNHNEKTGIAYGIISSNSLNGDVVQELMYGWQSKDLSYEAYMAEHGPDANYYQCAEPLIEGEYEGVKYQTSWLGGALHFFIFESPHVVKCAVCSPCVPGAGDLDNDGEYEAYGVPEEWKESHK